MTTLEMVCSKLLDFENDFFFVAVKADKYLTDKGICFTFHLYKMMSLQTASMIMTEDLHSTSSELHLSSSLCLVLYLFS